MKIVELFTITNNTTGKLIATRSTEKAVEQLFRVVDGLGLSRADFSVESEGQFKAVPYTYTLNSMSQADIDMGGDNDPVEMTGTQYIQL